MTSVLERKVQPFDLAVVGRVLLAVLSGTAGAIHLVMVPSHFALSTAEGIGFAVAGWIQLSIAVLLLVRTSRLLLLGAIIANAGAIAAWGFSRVWGLPFGSQAWHPATSSFIDLTAVGLETAFVVAAGVLLFRPSFGRGWDRRRLAFGAVVPLAILALTSAALASPSARDHAAGSHGTHGAGGAATEAQLNGLAMLENGHQQHGKGLVELDDATQAALATQLSETNTLVARYPNVAAAEANGYRRAGPFSPGLGAHYTGLGPGDRSADTLQGVDGPMNPLLIFDGVDPTSPIAGFMYMSYGGPGSAPEGFIGPNDNWHYHTNTCVVFKDGQIEAPLGADGKVTQKLCAKYGGRLIQNTGYMVHVWTVPGYESTRGTFSSVNPALSCPDGAYFSLPLEELGFKTTTCRNEGNSS